MKGPKNEAGIGTGRNEPNEAVLTDPTLTKLGVAHAQIDNPHDDNEHANWGGLESKDAD